MADVIKYNLSGVAQNVQFGKKGPRMKADTAFRFRNAADNAYSKLKIADGESDEDAVSKAQLDRVKIEKAAYIDGEFTSSDMVDGILTITHDKGLVKGLPGTITFESIPGIWDNVNLDDTSIKWSFNQIQLDLSVYGISEGAECYYAFGGAQIPSPYISGMFDASELVDGILTITHDKGLVRGLPGSVTFESGEGTWENINLDDTSIKWRYNQIEIDFSIYGLSGTSGAYYAFGGFGGAVAVADWARAEAKPAYTASEVGLGNVPNLFYSGSNTGDETNTTIKSKLGVTTLSGSNTGDQTDVTGSSGSCTGNSKTVTGLSMEPSKVLSVKNDITLTGTDGVSIGLGSMSATLGSAAFTSSSAYAQANHSHFVVLEIAPEPTTPGAVGQYGYLGLYKYTWIGTAQVIREAIVTTW
jgi:hypothetical protein